MAPGPAHLVILAAAASFMVASIEGHPARYDQRQEGESNIRADVQDVVFLIVPPKDLFTAGMGIATASAANLFRKNYFNDAPAPEKWSQRPQTKWTYNTPDKAPLKIDLNKPGIVSKKINHHGDPNRYNINDEKIPAKSITTSRIIESASESSDKTPKTDDAPTSTTSRSAESTTTTTTEKATTETDLDAVNKTVKKELKAEGAKKKAPTSSGDGGLAVSDQKVNKKKQEPVTESTAAAEDVPRVIGELSPGELGPTSIFGHEGCGPDAYRDVRGICIYKKNSSK